MREIGSRPAGDHPRPLRWVELRQLALARDRGCRCCGSLERLECHHRTYARWGAEDLDDLTILCRDCHDLITGAQMRIRDERRDLPVERITVEVERFEVTPQTIPQVSARATVTIERAPVDPVGILPLPARNNRGEVTP